MTTDSTSTDEAARRDASALQREVRAVAAEALRLADTPITSRGMLWQSNATATLREAAADLTRLRAADAALADVAMMLKTCAWALRRGSSPDLGERALVLLKKHGLLGTPLRDETLDEAGAAAAALYDRWTGKA